LPERQRAERNRHGQLHDSPPKLAGLFSHAVQFTMTKFPEWMVRIAGTKEGYAGIEPALVEQLRASGIIWQDGDELYIKPDDAYVLNTHPEHAVCDFCNATPCTWRARCTDFQIDAARNGLPSQESLSDWACCETCGQLIANDERHKLLQRCVRIATERFQKKYPGVPARAIRTNIELLQQKFWRHYQRIVRLAN